jgi:hypothetical protein
MSVTEVPRMLKDVKVIGEMSPAEMAEKLRAMGDVQAAEEVTRKAEAAGYEAGIFGWGTPRPWQYTTHQFGYVANRVAGSSDPQPIQYAGTMGADMSLQNSRINIHIDRLRVWQYPGGGSHNVLFTFEAQNQLPGSPEPVSFSQTYRVQEGQTAGVSGYPIFVGLNVGTLGAAFQGFTVNVNNAQDQSFLGLLDSPPFQAGLDLLTTVQPVLKPFTQMGLGIANLLARRNDNVAVQQFYLGLDFTQAAFGARLAEGNYIAAQVPSETAIDWADWIFSPTAGAIVGKTDKTQTLPYNYVVFRVSRYS